MNEPKASPVAPDAISAEARLAALEHAVERLTGQLAELHAEVHALRAPAEAAAASARPLQPPRADSEERMRELLSRPPAPARQAPRAAYDRRASLAERLSETDLERLVGRYGTLVLATVTGLAAVGTFLGWAIAHGMLGPAPRVALGVVAAVAVMAGGYRLRRREHAFGSTLMALGLAMLHVAAWAAGPSLHLVPSAVAFAIVGVISWAMAVFAQAEGDEPLWCAGFGGAAVAPFVTANGTSHAALLAAYGAAMLTAGGYALAGRPWRVAGRVFLAAATLFTGALISMPERELGPLLALALPLAVALVGVFPFAERGLLRPRLRWLGLLALAAAVRAAFAIGLPIGHPTLALLVGGAGVLWLMLCDRAREAPVGPAFEWLGEREGAVSGAPVGAWIEGFWIPLGFAALLPAALDGGWGDAALALGAAAVVVLGALARRVRGAERDALVAAASLCATAAVIVALHQSEVGIVAAVSGLSVALIVATLRWPSTSWVGVGGLSLIGVSAGALLLLTERVAYAYRPFGTPETAAAAAVLAAWIAVAWLAPRAGRAMATGDTAGGERALIRRARQAPWVFAFFWVHQEISWAMSPTAATLLRVSYYAATSVACVWMGRIRDSAALRHVGLGLALVAAGTALYGARGLSAIAARVAAYLVVSIFLLAIAYWYRRRSDEGVLAPAGLDAAPE